MHIGKRIFLIFFVVSIFLVVSVSAVDEVIITPNSFDLGDSVNIDIPSDSYGSYVHFYKSGERSVIHSFDFDCNVACTDPLNFDYIFPSGTFPPGDYDLSIYFPNINDWRRFPFTIEGPLTALGLPPEVPERAIENFANCGDTDGGIFYSTKGQIVVPVPGTDIFTEAETDACVDDELLREYYCTENGQTSTLKTCPLGCEDGACLEEVVEEGICEDSDGGRDYEIKGNIFGVCNDCSPNITGGLPTGGNSDHCADENNVREFYCEDADGWRREVVNCPAGCLDGVCLEEEVVEEVIEEEVIVEEPPITPPEPLVNEKDMSKYDANSVFFVSDKNWQDVLPIISASTWTGTENCNRESGAEADVCVYPTLIYHEEENSFDADSILDFFEEYGSTNVKLVNQADAPADFLDLISGTVENLDKENYLDLWSNYNEIIYVEENYEFALLASTYASLINAPLVVEGAEPLGIGADPAEVVCIGDPQGIICDRTLDFASLRQAYIDEAGVIDRAVIVNPDDLTISLSRVYRPERSPDVINELNTKNSLGATIFAAAKHDLIISTRMVDYQDVSDDVGVQIDSLSGFSPEELVIVASTNAIEEVDLADVQGILIDLDFQRIAGITISDVSGVIARNIFFDEDPFWFVTWISNLLGVVDELVLGDLTTEVVTINPNTVNNAFLASTQIIINHNNFFRDFFIYDFNGDEKAFVNLECAEDFCDSPQTLTYYVPQTWENGTYTVSVFYNDEWNNFTFEVIKEAVPGDDDDSGGATCLDTDGGVSPFVKGHGWILPEGHGAPGAGDELNLKNLPDVCQTDTSVLDVVCNDRAGERPQLDDAGNQIIGPDGNPVMEPVRIISLDWTAVDCPDRCEDGACVVECTDTDGGAFRYGRGEVRVTSQGFESVEKDICVSSGTIKEFTCRDPPDFLAFNAFFEEQLLNCEFGCRGGVLPHRCCTEGENCQPEDSDTTPDPVSVTVEEPTGEEPQLEGELTPVPPGDGSTGDISFPEPEFDLTLTSVNVDDCVAVDVNSVSLTTTSEENIFVVHDSSTPGTELYAYNLDGINVNVAPLGEGSDGDGTIQSHINPDDYGYFGFYDALEICVLGCMDYFLDDGWTREQCTVNPDPVTELNCCEVAALEDSAFCDEWIAQEYGEETTTGDTTIVSGPDLDPEAGLDVIPGGSAGNVYLVSGIPDGSGGTSPVDFTYVNDNCDLPRTDEEEPEEDPPQDPGEPPEPEVDPTDDESSGGIFLTGECLDTDGGLDYYERGSSRDVGFGGGAGVVDCCKAGPGAGDCTDEGQYLHEATCTPEGEPSSQAYECGIGCNMGACIQNSAGDELRNLKVEEVVYQDRHNSGTGQLYVSYCNDGIASDHTFTISLQNGDSELESEVFTVPTGCEVYEVPPEFSNFVEGDLVDITANIDSRGLVEEVSEDDNRYRRTFSAESISYTSGETFDFYEDGTDVSTHFGNAVSVIGERDRKRISTNGEITIENGFVISGLDGGVYQEYDPWSQQVSVRGGDSQISNGHHTVSYVGGEIEIVSDSINPGYDAPNIDATFVEGNNQYNVKVDEISNEVKVEVKESGRERTVTIPATDYNEIRERLRHEHITAKIEELESLLDEVETELFQIEQGQSALTTGSDAEKKQITELFRRRLLIKAMLSQLRNQDEIQSGDFSDIIGELQSLIEDSSGVVFNYPGGTINFDSDPDVKRALNDIRSAVAEYTKGDADRRMNAASGSFTFFWPSMFSGFVAFKDNKLHFKTESRNGEEIVVGWSPDGVKFIPLSQDVVPSNYPTERYRGINIRPKGLSGTDAYRLLEEFRSVGGSFDRWKKEVKSTIATSADQPIQESRLGDRISMRGSSDYLAAIAEYERIIDLYKQIKATSSDEDITHQASLSLAALYLQLRKDPTQTEARTQDARLEYEELDTSITDSKFNSVKAKAKLGLGLLDLENRVYARALTRITEAKNLDPTSESIKRVHRDVISGYLSATNKNLGDASGKVWSSFEEKVGLTEWKARTPGEIDSGYFSDVIFNSFTIIVEGLSDEATIINQGVQEKISSKQLGITLIRTLLGSGVSQQEISDASFAELRTLLSKKLNIKVITEDEYKQTYTERTGLSLTLLDIDRFNSEDRVNIEGMKVFLGSDFDSRRVSDHTRISHFARAALIAMEDPDVALIMSNGDVSASLARSQRLHPGAPEEILRQDLLPYFRFETGEFVDLPESLQRSIGDEIIGQINIPNILLLLAPGAQVRGISLVGWTVRGASAVPILGEVITVAGELKMAISGARIFQASESAGFFSFRAGGLGGGVGKFFLAEGSETLVGSIVGSFTDPTTGLAVELFLGHSGAFDLSRKLSSIGVDGAGKLGKAYVTHLEGQTGEIVQSLVFKDDAQIQRFLTGVDDVKIKSLGENVVEYEGRKILLLTENAADPSSILGSEVLHSLDSDDIYKTIGIDDARRIETDPTVNVGPDPVAPDLSSNALPFDSDEALVRQSIDNYVDSLTAKQSASAAEVVELRNQLIQRFRLSDGLTQDQMASLRDYFRQQLLAKGLKSHPDLRPDDVQRFIDSMTRERGYLDYLKALGDQYPDHQKVFLGGDGLEYSKTAYETLTDDTNSIVHLINRRFLATEEEWKAIIAVTESGRPIERSLKPDNIELYETINDVVIRSRRRLEGVTDPNAEFDRLMSEGFSSLMEKENLREQVLKLVNRLSSDSNFVNNKKIVLVDFVGSTHAQAFTLRQGVRWLQSADNWNGLSAAERELLGSLNQDTISQVTVDLHLGIGKHTNLDSPDFALNGIYRQGTGDEITRLDLTDIVEARRTYEIDDNSLLGGLDNVRLGLNSADEIADTLFRQLLISEEIRKLRQVPEIPEPTIPSIVTYSEGSIDVDALRSMRGSNGDTLLKVEVESNGRVVRVENVETGEESLLVRQSELDDPATDLRSKTGEDLSEGEPGIDFTISNRVSATEVVADLLSARRIDPSELRTSLDNAITGATQSPNIRDLTSSEVGSTLDSFTGDANIQSRSREFTEKYTDVGGIIQKMDAAAKSGDTELLESLSRDLLKTQESVVFRGEVFGSSEDLLARLRSLRDNDAITSLESLPDNLEDLRSAVSAHRTEVIDPAGDGVIDTVRRNMIESRFEKSIGSMSREELIEMDRYMHGLRASGRYVSTSELPTEASRYARAGIGTTVAGEIDPKSWLIFEIDPNAVAGAAPIYKDLVTDSLRTNPQSAIGSFASQSETTFIGGVPLENVRRIWANGEVVWENPRYYVQVPEAIAPFP